jgi:hypothetical protein
MSETDTIIESENRALAWPALLAVSLFLPWVTVSGIINIQRSGVQIDTGILLLFGVAIIIASWFYEDGKYRDKVWLYGGIVVGLLSIASIFYIQSQIGQYRADVQGNLFSNTVQISIGFGAYLAAISSIAIIYVGYKMYNDENHTNNSQNKEE